MDAVAPAGAQQGAGLFEALLTGLRLFGSCSLPCTKRGLSRQGGIAVHTALAQRVDQLVECRRVDIPLLGQQRLERPDANIHGVELAVVIVVFVIMSVPHPARA